MKQPTELNHLAIQLYVATGSAILSYARDGAKDYWWVLTSDGRVVVGSLAHTPEEALRQALERWRQADAGV